MSIRRRSSLGALRGGLLAAAFVTAGCGGEAPSGPREPVPADLILTLEGALPGDQAVLLEIGPEATAVAPGSSNVEVHVGPHLQGWVVAVFGSLRGEPLLRVTVPDRTQQPTVKLREIATEDGTLRDELSAYAPRLAVVR